jgi:hypothetical protein
MTLWGSCGYDLPEHQSHEIGFISIFKNFLSTKLMIYVKISILGTGGIFSCAGEYMDTLPDLDSQVPVDRLRLYAVRNIRNVHQIKSYQFFGYRTKEIRIEYMEELHLQDRAFEGVLDLETLRLTHNNFQEMGQPDLIFTGLVNLTTLDLSYNQITSWKSGGTIYVDLLQSLRMKLRTV